MSYAQPDDVAVRWQRTLTPEEEALVAVRLDDVERKILARFRRAGRDLAEEIASGAIDVDDVIRIESDVVLGLVRNPDGIVSETDGDYTYMLSQRVADSQLSPTDDDWRDLGFSSGIWVLAPSLDIPQ